METIGPLRQRLFQARSLSTANAKQFRHGKHEVNIGGVYVSRVIYLFKGEFYVLYENEYLKVNYSEADGFKLGEK